MSNSTELPTDFQKYIHLSRYARWNEEEKRRETWDETVCRLTTFWRNTLDKKQLPDKELNELREAITNLEVMPSMRTLMTAGKALERDNIAGYNCAYVAVDHPRVFDEILYILMNGTGVGFSVERQFIGKLPEIAEEFSETATTITVGDSKAGWAKAYRELVSLLYQGSIPKWDTSRVRGAGERLKTFGGRASGPKPLVDLFTFTVEVFKNAQGRKLSSIECHDIVCKVADVVVVGGVRRSALISLSNLTDERMRNAKHGDWWTNNGQRSLANNSVCYTEKPDMGVFMREWRGLYDSKSGERGIFNREAAQALIPDRRKELGYEDFGCNPCSEIVLRSKQFCNLTEVVVRPNDTLDILKEKVRKATILGTMQSTLTDFKYISKAWTTNTEEERLLGVSLTGIMDHPVLSGKGYDTPLVFTGEHGGKLTLDMVLRELKEVAIETNKEWAKKLGITPSTAITCVKPSGTVSQLVDSSSGIHTRHSPYYIRTVRGDAKDPLTQMMVDKGFPWEWNEADRDSEGNLRYNTRVFSFPMKAPEGAITRDDVDVLQQLELWKIYQLNYTEHKPSITVSVREEEWMKCGAWVYDNFGICSGVSFLPHSEHTYAQAPYQECTEEDYEKLILEMPKDVDWDELGNYETDDTTINYKELACSSGSCEI